MRTAFKVLIGVAAAIVVLAAAGVAVVAYFAAPFIEMADEINEMNEMMEESQDSIIAGFMELPETAAFVQKHPDYEPQFYDLGLGYELLLLTPDGENSLRIEVDKEANERTIAYNCTAPDGSSDAYMEDDLAARIPAMCN